MEVEKIYRDDGKLCGLPTTMGIRRLCVGKVCYKVNGKLMCYRHAAHAALKFLQAETTGEFIRKNRAA